jgi:Ca2+-transporting ATPase
MTDSSEKPKPAGNGDKSSRRSVDDGLTLKPWSAESDQVFRELDVSPEHGLTPEEVKKRRSKYGRNLLRQAKRRSVCKILVDQFKSLILLLLVIAAILAFSFGQVLEGFAIIAAIFINAAIGFVIELKAVRSMESLRELGTVETTVLRNGETTKVAADELVPGDIVLLEGGDVVTADLRLCEASKLRANESILTGESVPVGKDTEPLGDDTPLAERENMLFKGTSVTAGSGRGVVVATGMDTELGHTTSLVEEVEKEQAPLQKRLDKLGHRLVWITLGIVAVVAVIGIVAGRQILTVIETAIALAVAMVPEGLPIVATIALARGMWRMARRKALVERLPAVETLGSTNVILTDKTGTLTENLMTVTRIVLARGEVEVSGSGLEREGEFTLDGKELNVEDNEDLNGILKVGVLCNNASLPETEEDEQAVVGDPLEAALLVAGAKAGYIRKDILDEMPEEREVAFDPEIKMMATFNKSDGNLTVSVKGAPEAVLDVCTEIQEGSERRRLDDEERQRWRKKNKDLAMNGLRVLAAASKGASDTGTDPYAELTLLGLLAMEDPPREDVAETIHTCHRAGIRVVMVTGDQAETALSVGKSLNLIDESEQEEAINGSALEDIDSLGSQDRKRVMNANIFSRTSPERKLDLLSFHQEEGSVVTMIGDGVNDAPALKKADIGVAMGRRGTQVAREAADIILQDDEFSTVITAAEYGRSIFNNIRKFVLFLLSGNTSEILAVGLASMAGIPLPLRPLQILFINMVLDVYPALALGLGEPEPGLMEKPPRDPGEAVLTRKHWVSIMGFGALIMVPTLFGLLIALHWMGMSKDEAVTVSFLTLAFARLWHVFNMRDRRSRFMRNEVTTNVWVWGAIGICVALLLATVYVPGLSTVLETAKPDGPAWLLILGLSLVPFVVGQLVKSMSSRKQGE